VAGPSKDVGALAKLAPKGVQWISCGGYHQALPFVTGERVVVVAGTGELEYGRDHLSPAERDRWFREEVQDLLPTAQRMRAEDPSRPVMALVDIKWAWRHLSKADQGAFEVLARNEGCLLVRLR